MIKRLPIDLTKSYVTKPLNPDTYLQVVTDGNPGVMHRIYLIANELKDRQHFMELEHEDLSVSAVISTKFGYSGDAKNQAGLIKFMKDRVNQRPEFTLSFRVYKKVNMIDLFEIKHRTTNRQKIYDLIAELEEKLTRML
jgi:hypothetical protein